MLNHAPPAIPPTQSHSPHRLMPEGDAIEQKWSFKTLFERAIRQGYDLSSVTSRIEFLLRRLKTSIGIEGRITAKPVIPSASP